MKYILNRQDARVARKINMVKMFKNIFADSFIP